MRVFFDQPDKSEGCAAGQSPINIKCAAETLSELKKDRFLRVGAGAGTVDLLDFPAFRKMAAALSENDAEAEPEPDYTPVAQSPYAPEDPEARSRELLNLIDRIEAEDIAGEEEKQRKIKAEPETPRDPYNTGINQAEEYSSEGIGEFPHSQAAPKFLFTRDDIFFEDDF